MNNISKRIKFKRFESKYSYFLRKYIISTTDPYIFDTQYLTNNMVNKLRIMDRV